MDYNKIKNYFYYKDLNHKKEFMELFLKFMLDEYEDADNNITNISASYWRSTITNKNTGYYVNIPNPSSNYRDIESSFYEINFRVDEENKITEVWIEGSDNAQQIEDANLLIELIEKLREKLREKVTKK